MFGSLYLSYHPSFFKKFKILFFTFLGVAIYKTSEKWKKHASVIGIADSWYFTMYQRWIKSFCICTPPASEKPGVGGTRDMSGRRPVFRAKHSRELQKCWNGGCLLWANWKFVENFHRDRFNLILYSPFGFSQKVFLWKEVFFKWRMQLW